MERISGCTSGIYGLETVAAAAAVKAGGDLAGPGDKKVIVFVDNNSTLAAITRGGARSPLVNSLVGDLWLGIDRMGWYVWWERVPTKANPADDPSRTAQPLRGWGRLRLPGFTA